MILDRYIMLETLKGYALALVVLLVLVSLIDLLEQLEDVGDHAYRSAHAVGFVVLTMPTKAIALLPFAILLGALYGLADLERHSEVTVIRNLGVSNLRIALPVLLSAGLLLALAVASDNYLASPLNRTAFLARELFLAEEGELLSGSGFWTRNERTYVNVASLKWGQIPGDIHIFELDDEGKVDRVIQAAYARVDEQAGEWLLVDVDTRDFRDGHVTRRIMPELSWKPFWLASIPMQTLPFESLSLEELREYIDYLRTSGQQTHRARLNLWQRFTLPLTGLSMAFLAVPFAIGSTRERGFTRKLMTGALVGIGFYLGTQISASAALLADVAPALIALIPGAIAAGLGGWLLRRAA
ncbi:MAG: LPS export ABC transporter permease LptG [Pseudomonadales bacterium]